MATFRAGVASAALATLACALLIGQGDLSKGWSALARGAQTTAGHAAQDVAKWTAKAERALAQGGAKVALWAHRETSHVQAGADQAADWAGSKVGQAQAAWNRHRPIDAAIAAPLEIQARAAQSELRQALMGQDADSIDAKRLQADRLPPGATPSQQWARGAALRAMGVALARDPWVRSAALPGADAPSPDSAPSKAELAFADAFVEALTSSASPSQARQWGLPAPRGSARPQIDPLSHALGAGVKAAKVAAKHQPSQSASPIPSALLWEEKGSGAARAFAAQTLAAQAPSVGAKLGARRAAKEAAQPSAPRSSPGA